MAQNDDDNFDLDFDPDGDNEGEENGLSNGKECTGTNPIFTIFAVDVAFRTVDSRRTPIICQRT